MNAADIENQVRKFITDSFLYRTGGQLTDDTSFLELGLIDSTGVLELVMFLEKSFGIKVGDEEIVPDNLDSVRKIGQYVRQKQGAGVSGAAGAAAR